MPHSAAHSANTFEAAPRGINVRSLVLQTAIDWGMDDPLILAAIVQAESGFDASIINRGTSTNPEMSVGLLQNNMRGGAGAGYTVKQLQSPELNLGIRQNEIMNAYDIGVKKGLAGADLAIYVGRVAQRPRAGAEMNYGVAYRALRNEVAQTVFRGGKKGLASPLLEGEGDDAPPAPGAPPPDDIDAILSSVGMGAAYLQWLNSVPKVANPVHLAVEANDLYNETLDEVDQMAAAQSIGIDKDKGFLITNGPQILTSLLPDHLFADSFEVNPETRETASVPSAEDQKVDAAGRPTGNVPEPLGGVSAGLGTENIQRAANREKIDADARTFIAKVMESMLLEEAAEKATVEAKSWTKTQDLVLGASLPRRSEFGEGDAGKKAYLDALQSHGEIANNWRNADDVSKAQWDQVKQELVALTPPRVGAGGGGGLTASQAGNLALRGSELELSRQRESRFAAESKRDAIFAQQSLDRTLAQRADFNKKQEARLKRDQRGREFAVGQDVFANLQQFTLPKGAKHFPGYGPGGAVAQARAIRGQVFDPSMAPKPTTQTVDPFAFFNRSVS